MRLPYLFLFWLAHLATTVAFGSEFFSVFGFNEAGQILEWKRLRARAGVGVALSHQNFDSVGDRLDVRLNGSSAKFSEVRFLTQAEYGVAEDWAVGAEVNALTSSLSTAAESEPLANGAGLGDILTSVKYNFKTTNPQMTAEVRVKFPVGRSEVDTLGDLALGDGSIDVTGALHLSYQSSRWKFLLSSGLMGRSSRYAPALLAGGAVEFLFGRGYARAFGESYFSLQESLRTDSGLDFHDALGSGGTYLRLAGSPSFFKAGGQLGFQLWGAYYLEAQASHTVWGVRAPHYLQMTFQLRGTWDFFSPDTRKKVRELPLDSDGSEKFYGP